MKIVLIGAGPRNLVLVERLLAYAKTTAGLHDIIIADPYPIGGAVWTPDQNPRFIANTISRQLTLFTDDTVTKARPGLNGPTFYEWAHSEAADYLEKHPSKNKGAFLNEIATLNPNQFASRALFGLYAQYYFEKLKQHVPENTQLHFEQKAVEHVIPINGNQFKIIFSDKSETIADVLVDTPGYTKTALTDEEQQFSSIAEQNALIYLPPMHPSEAPLAKIKAKTTVIMRGLGLNFFDYLSELTIGRGGQFERLTDDTLKYHPSGQEPNIIAGSRSGTIPHAKAYNQKEQAEDYHAIFFTKANIEARMNNHHITYADFFDLLQKEMTYKYYFNLMSDPAVNWSFNRQQFLSALQNSNDLNATANSFGVPKNKQIDWSQILNPLSGEHLDYQDFIQRNLQADIVDARKGNDLAPYAGAFELLKDLRGQLREYLNQDYLTVDEYEKFLKNFNPINRLLNIGPPILRIEQLHALITAGVVTIAAPKLAISVKADSFVATDSNHNQWQSTQLVEARMPPISIQHTVDSVFNDLKANDLITNVNLVKNNGTNLTIDAVYNNRQSLQAINAQGNVIKNLYIHGTPTENWNWFTSFAPRPNVNDKNLRDAEQIAQHIFN